MTSAQSGMESSALLAEARIGVLTPPGLRLDREYWDWAAGLASIYFTRCTAVDGPMSPERARSQSRADIIRPAVEQIAHVDPHVVAYACTMGSFVDGLTGERDVRGLLRCGSAKTVTTSGALLKALRKLGLTRVAVATPYTDSVTDRLVAFLSEAGCEVVSRKVLGRQDAEAVAYEDDESIVDLARCADSSSADALFISCTNLPTYRLMTRLQAMLGKPVLSANQVTIWAALDLLGLADSIVHPGQALFDPSATLRRS